tara:strand:- start:1486 stop:1818 length:333 start_codon:yes stop_codon:yes gene_type:complete
MDAIKYCEINYPTTTVEFKKIQKEQYELFCKKQMDYGPNNISLNRDLSMVKNKQFCHQGLWFRMNDKIARLQNLIWKEESPNNESMEDSWIDLSNYGIISLLVSREKWGN